MRIADSWFKDKYFYYKGFIGTVEPEDVIGYTGRVVKEFYDNGFRMLEEAPTYDGIDIKELYYYFTLAVDQYIEQRNYNIGETFFNKV